ncbi:MAG: hypothetical protein K0R70_2083 [Steroidobacteraceae bacterium]|nr:hypothetical protein [Steroidobacteraceae bacterium]
MKLMSFVSATIAASISLVGAVHAESTAVGSCSDVRWKPDILAKYPDITKSCVGVVERDGKRYVKLSGKVTEKTSDSVKVLLDHTKTHMLWEPMTGDMVSIEGKDVPAMSVMKDQKLRFYLPESQVATK